MSSVLTSKGIAILLIALLAGVGVGTFIIAPVMTSNQQQQQNLILAYTFGQASGSLYIPGSTTVLPITTEMAPAFTARNPFITIQAAGGGSGAGYSAIINQQTDIAAASREPKSSEIASATAAGVKLITWIIGADAIVVIYNSQGLGISAVNLTRAQVGEIFNASAKGIGPVYWDAYVPGAPHQPITVFIREDGSGTRGDFESDFQVDKTGTWPGVTKVTSNGLMISSVKSQQYSMGYVALSYYTAELADPTSPIRGVNVAYNSSYDYETPDINGVISWAKAQITDPGVYTGGYFACRWLYYITDGFPEPGSLIDRYLGFVYSSAGQAIIEKVGYVSVEKAGLTTGKPYWYYSTPIVWN
ncbi:MAG: substrate-binding domain-containing protein [Candidatus Jordarchaeaceae archaeon]